MARTGIELVGTKRMAKALRDLPEAMRRELLADGVQAAGRVYVAEARNTAPRGATRELRDAIDSRTSLKLSDKYRAVVEVGVALNVQSSRKPGFYGVMLERGTKDRKRKSGGATGRVRARWWLRRAFKRGKARATAKVKGSVLRAVRETRLPRVS